jgi:hypothetical protein
MSTPRRGRIALLVSLLLAACGDDPPAVTADDRSTSVEGEPCPAPQVSCGGTCIEPIAPRAEVIQERVFTRSCALSSSCHDGAAAPEELRLGSLDDLFASAVGRASRQMPELSLIEPGRPEDSYLIKKLRDMVIAAQSSSGAPSTAMPPPPSAALCEPKIRAIEAWITRGASR